MHHRMGSQSRQCVQCSGATGSWMWVVSAVRSWESGSARSGSLIGSPHSPAETASDISRLAWVWFCVHQAVFGLIISIPGSLVLGRRVFWWETWEFWSLKWDPLHREWICWCLVHIWVDCKLGNVNHSLLEWLPTCCASRRVAILSICRSSLLIESHVSSKKYSPPQIPLQLKVAMGHSAGPCYVDGNP